LPDSLWTPLTYIVEEKKTWKIPSTVWVAQLFKTSFCVQQKKEILTGLEQHESD